jgi:hypothetical protein
MMLEFGRGNVRPLCTELVLEEAVDRPQDRICSEWDLFLQQKLWFCPAYLLGFLLSSRNDFYKNYINIRDSD